MFDYNWRFSDSLARPETEFSLLKRGVWISFMRDGSGMVTAPHQDGS
jgi:hypothetical protein